MHPKYVDFSEARPAAEPEFFRREEGLPSSSAALTHLPTCTEDSCTTSHPEAGVEASSRRSHYKLTFSSCSLNSDPGDGMPVLARKSGSMHSQGNSSARTMTTPRKMISGSPPTHTHSGLSQAAYSPARGGSLDIPGGRFGNSLASHHRYSHRGSGLHRRQSSGTSLAEFEPTGPEGEDRIGRQLDAWNQRWYRPDGFQSYYESLGEPGEASWL